MPPPCECGFVCVCNGCLAACKTAALSVLPLSVRMAAPATSACTTWRPIFECRPGTKLCLLEASRRGRCFHTCQAHRARVSMYANATVVAGQALVLVLLLLAVSRPCAGQPHSYATASARWLGGRSRQCLCCAQLGGFCLHPTIVRPDTPACLQLGV
jgi:hypothetical protein